MKPLPSISIVIPTRGRAAQLGRCLAGVARLDYPPHLLDAVVVDDGSDEPVRAVSAAPFAVRLHRQANAGPASARNAGVRLAHGEVVAFLDDDCTPDPGWARAVADALSAERDAGVGGTVVNALARNRYAEASQLLVSYLVEYFNADSGRAQFLTSNNMAFWREALLAAGAFNEQYQRPGAEDRELCDRWVSQGRRLVFARGAVVRHAHDLTFRRFVRQHVSYGRGAWAFRLSRASRGTGRVRLEPLAFYRGLLAYPLRQHGPAGVAHSALLVLAQAANAVGFFWEAVRTRRGSQPSSSSRR